MRLAPLPLALLLCVPGAAFAHDMVVDPYLQLAQPTSVRLMWETTGGTESLVEWGATAALGESSTGTAATGSGSSQVHDVELSGLDPATRYYYRVQTEDAVSAVYDFMTPPEASAEASFRLAAMSDMQGPPSNKFDEIVHDGVIDFVTSEYSADLAAELGLVLIPGDLVSTGSNYSQWEEHFFDPAAPLFSHVPVYPVPGNHEGDTPYFFQYFHLPDNGSFGYEEHWWHHDYSNLRVIGLDSNVGYRVSEQLDWLEDVLAQTCTDADIDFVFAQLHHPWLSELWTPGETTYTGDVVSRLESFSTDCGKPSIHFFGHTHGYSRGQSRDHQHLMVNVATAGGAIDRWGAFPQADYDEFTVSQDDWGFVFVEVEAGDDPSFRLRRVSRGNGTTFRDNEVRDEISIRVNNTPPTTPEVLGPIGAAVDPVEVTLVASFFEDPDGDELGAAHWQVSTDCSDFSAPMVDRWVQHENQYFGVDTQAGDDLADEVVMGLDGLATYCVRLRYRDQGLAWSDWSTPLAFTTDVSPLGPNLLLNPGAEDDIEHWTVVTGVVESLTSGTCSGTVPHSGKRYFGVGGLCEESAYAEAYQDVDISAHAADVDAGLVIVHLTGWLSNWNGADRPEFTAQFLGEDGGGLGDMEVLTSLSTQWVKLATETVALEGARTVRVAMMGTRNEGTDNDSYLDDLQLRLELAGSTGDDDDATGDDDDSSGGDDSGAYEGDEPGECGDGADNDRDGTYDCADEDCAGAPECEGGCGCAASATQQGSPWGLLFLFTLLLARRRTYGT